MEVLADLHIFRLSAEQFGLAIEGRRRNLESQIQRASLN
jgi:hypothetical protein